MPGRRRRTGLGRPGHPGRSAPATVLVLLGLAVTMLLPSACGVPQDGRTVPLDTDQVPFGLLDPTPTNATSTSPGVGADEVSARIALVASEDRLILASRTIERGTTREVAAAVLVDLIVGPTAAERDRGLRSGLPSGTDLALSSMQDGVASVDLPADLQSLPSERVPLAVGQIVLSLTSVTGVTEVLLVRDGEPVAAPLVDGSLTSEPLTRDDYTALLHPEVSVSGTTGSAGITNRRNTATSSSPTA